MGRTSTDICNQALSFIVEDELSGSLNESQDENAILCRVHLQQAVDEVLEWMAPDCCHDEASLVKDATFTANSYQLTYRYALPEEPTHCLRVLKVNGKLLKKKGKVIGRKLATNDDSAFILFASRISNYDHLTPQVALAIAYNLAIKLAVPKQKADSDRKRLMDEYESIIGPRAFAIENLNTPESEDIDHESSWGSNTNQATSLDEY